MMTMMMMTWRDCLSGWRCHTHRHACSEIKMKHNHRHRENGKREQIRKHMYRCSLSFSGSVPFPLLLPSLPVPHQIHGNTPASMVFGEKKESVDLFAASLPLTPSVSPLLPISLLHFAMHIHSLMFHEHTSNEKKLLSLPITLCVSNTHLFPL